MGKEASRFANLGVHEVAQLGGDDFIRLAVEFRIIEADVDDVDRFLGHWERRGGCLEEDKHNVSIRQGNWLRHRKKHNL